MRTESEAASAGPLAAAQVRMFEAFGYLHCRGAFTAAEAAHRALPFPDAETSVYQPAAEHRLRTGMKPWRSVEGR